MEVIVIKRHCDNAVVDVVEVAAGFTSSAVALMWARSNGHENFPTDCKFEGGVRVTPLASVMRGIMPCSEIERIEDEAKKL